MKLIGFVLLTSLSVAFGDIETTLMSEYRRQKKNIYESSSGPVMEPSTIVLRDGDKSYFVHRLNSSLLFCVKGEKILKDDLARGLFHEKAFIRATCIRFINNLAKEQGVVINGGGILITDDPFKEKKVWAYVVSRKNALDKLDFTKISQ